jgi:hypothetical protein
MRAVRAAVAKFDRAIPASESLWRTYAEKRFQFFYGERSRPVKRDPVTPRSDTGLPADFYRSSTRAGPLCAEICSYHSSQHYEAFNGLLLLGASRLSRLRCATRNYTDTTHAWRSAPRECRSSDVFRIRGVNAQPASIREHHISTGTV